VALATRELLELLAGRGMVCRVFSAALEGPTPIRPQRFAGGPLPARMQVG